MEVWWEAVLRRLNAPVPGWVGLLLIFMLWQVARMITDLREKLGNIGDDAEQLRRKFAPTEAEKRRDFFGE